MTRYVFEEISIRGEKTVKCSGGCGRRLVRKNTFLQTLNPFNKKADGSLKARGDIYPELERERDAWKVEQEQCDHCIKRDEDKQDLNALRKLCALPAAIKPRGEKFGESCRRLATAGFARWKQVKAATPTGIDFLCESTAKGRKHLKIAVASLRPAGGGANE